MTRQAPIPLTDRRAFLRGAACCLIPARAVARDAATFEVVLSDAEWRARLSPDRYAVLRETKTEPPGSSPLNGEHRKGLFACAGCDAPLFSSVKKFESGTGWPSFSGALPKAVATKADHSGFMTRTEVHCRRCGGHLGHLFDDGPRPTGRRYCINGLALQFHAAA